ncbi:hypothetical protein [Rhodococcus sp. B10]|uniref:hypothetical protein n=1 Tax=Rhodococcus sp. B10 TaxID=2695876 RepID=UPI00142FE3B8|nr:hypothetical protein [Rhodococcus sp. B10]NIL77124.1 hypothetical protein [Rhodococcus sp. B10]
MEPLQLKQKQAEVIDAANDPTVDTIVLIGAVGTGKTDVAAHLVLSICQSFPKTRWPVFRVNQSTAVETVIPSYLDMAERMGMIQGQDFVYTQKPYRITFPNGSTIPFREADATKDRGGKKIKGINATGNHLDEVDEFEYDMFLQATSRRGRKNEHGQPSLSILTANPNDGWLKEHIYDKWKAGELPPNIRVIEFGLEDSWQSEADVAALLTNPTWWVERYLHNNWNYADEDGSLFKSRHFAASMTDELDAAAQRAAGYDVAWKGVDRSVRGLLYGLTIADITVVKAKGVRMETKEQADWLVEDAGDNGYGIDNTAIDAVGIGGGMVGDLVTMHLHPYEYESGGSPDPDVMLPGVAPTPLHFADLRTQMIYLYARGLELGIIKHYSGCPFLKELQKEAMMHQYEITNKVLKVESKQQIKKRLGVSPDLFDAVIMGLYVALRPVPEFENQADGNGSSAFGGGADPLFGGLSNSRF